MPIKVPDNLPALSQLQNENVDIIPDQLAVQQDIRPLRLLMLNLMPKKKDTEIQFARLLGSSPLQVELILMTTASYQPSNTEPAYLRRYYRQLEDVKDEYFDALIVTGAPVETLDFDKVHYWAELKEIYEWSKTHCFRRLGICWGAQALMNLAYDVPKFTMETKLFGVYAHNLAPKSGRLLHGFTQEFPMPVSRYTMVRAEDITAAGLTVLAQSDEVGVGMVRCDATQDLFVLNHLEYDAETLAAEYDRDINEGLTTNIPANYYPQNNPENTPINYWRPFAYLLISNWLNDLYQTTLYDLSKLSDNG